MRRALASRRRIATIGRDDDCLFLGTLMLMMPTPTFRHDNSIAARRSHAEGAAFGTRGERLMLYAAAIRAGAAYSAPLAL